MGVFAPSLHQRKKILDDVIIRKHTHKLQEMHKTNGISNCSNHQLVIWEVSLKSIPVII